MPHPAKILVTGSTGFVGKAVLDSWDSVVVWPREADLCRWNLVRDAAARLVKEESFDGVLHLAGQASQRKSYERTVETWEVNVQGTVHLTEALTDLLYRIDCAPGQPLSDYLLAA